LLSACATSGFQTRSVLESPPDVPKRMQLERVPFVEQTEKGYCGPSALAMAMRSAGEMITPEALVPEIYSAEKKGSLPAELISTSRRHGFLAVQIDGLAGLLKEVAAGHPVIVFENLGLSWWPTWHYSVVVGYDLNEQEIIRHSGSDAFKHQSLNYFERSWKLGDYWGLVVLPPTELAAGSGELGNLQGAVGLEKAGLPNEAEKVYRNVLKSWPGSLAALIGLGNLAYQSGDYHASVKYLRQAVKAHPEAMAAKHNLEIAEKSARKLGLRRIK
jgi:tetratricopeptide (TPR) repeat protein